LNIPIVLDQFELKLIQICYIQIQYIQFCIKIIHVIQIVVHQFVRKTSAKKDLSVKNWFPFIPRYAGIRRISTKEKKMIPCKPYVRKKHVESILGTFLTHEKTKYSI
jgi:hypothetical protein